MSHDDSLDDEVKALLASNDSKELQEEPSVKDKENKNKYDVKKPDEYQDVRWETNTEDSPDSEW